MTTTERTKRRSEPLLEPAEYDEQTLDRLEAERLTISNRISGVTTQIKRAGEDAKKRRELERRLKGLQTRRDKVGKVIQRKRAEQTGDMPGTLNARAGESATDS